MNGGDNSEAKLGPPCNSCHTAKTRYDWSIKKRRRKTANSIKPIKRNLKAGPEMRTKFTCPKCRAGLIAVGASWGKIKGCPKCSSMINVPCPTKDELYRFTCDLPSPLPGESIAAYLDLHKEIVVSAVILIRTCRHVGIVEFAELARENAVRALRNVKTFITHEIEKESGRAQRRGSTLRMGDMASLGSFEPRKQRRKNRRWAASQPPAKPVVPVSSDLNLVNASIERLNGIKI